MNSSSSGSNSCGGGGGRTSSSSSSSSSRSSCKMCNEQKVKCRHSVQQSGGGGSDASSIDFSKDCFLRECFNVIVSKYDTPEPLGTILKNNGWMIKKSKSSGYQTEYIPPNGKSSDDGGL